MTNNESQEEVKSQEENSSEVQLQSRAFVELSELYDNYIYRFFLPVGSTFESAKVVLNHWQQYIDSKLKELEEEKQKQEVEDDGLRSE